MSKNILSEEKIKELAKAASADEATFLKYFKIFQSLYTTETSTSYANYFHKVSLFDLQNINSIKNEDSFLKAITAFINEVTHDKKKIYLDFSNDETVTKIIKVLKGLKDPKKFIYVLKGENIDFSKHKEIFQYMEMLNEPNFFDEFTKKAIEEQIDVAKLYYVDLDQINIDKALEYCKKYPNRIRELYSFENKEYEKIQQVCELNIESLIRVPNCRIDLYSKLKNIQIITINSEALPNPLPENFCYDTVKELETIFIEDDTEEKLNEALNLINKCPNVEVVSFSTLGELTQEQFFNIFTKTTSKKIRKIEVTCQEFDDQPDFTPIFENLPKLAIMNIDCHCSMDFMFSLHPCISCEKFAPSNENLEKLLTNYLKEDEGNYIDGKFEAEFEGFYEYFKDKKEIMMRFNSCMGGDCANHEVPYVRELNVDSLDCIKECIAKKVETLNIMIPIDDEVKKFVAKVQPDFVKIKEGKLDDNNGIKIVYYLDKEEINC